MGGQRRRRRRRRRRRARRRRRRRRQRGRRRARLSLLTKPLFHRYPGLTQPFEYALALLGLFRCSFYGIRNPSLEIITFTIVLGATFLGQIHSRYSCKTPHIGLREKLAGRKALAKLVVGILLTTSYQHTPRGALIKIDTLRLARLELALRDSAQKALVACQAGFLYYPIIRIRGVACRGPRARLLLLWCSAGFLLRVWGVGVQETNFARQRGSSRRAVQSL